MVKITLNMVKITLYGEYYNNYVIFFKMLVNIKLSSFTFIMNGRSLLFVFMISNISIVNALSCFGGRAGCIASCMVQNCATGYCIPFNSPPREQICHCSRCENGPPIPFG